MTSVLGIDAAWAEGQPSGVALVQGRGSKWKCLAVAPSYDSFLALARGGVPVNWETKPVGGKPPVDDLLNACRKMLKGSKLDIVAVDMPLSLKGIRGRRNADDEISRSFGKYGCGVHSPSPERPGKITKIMSKGLSNCGFKLATKTARPVSDPVFLEVYPHTALLKLLDDPEPYRVEYKISKASKYWPAETPKKRRRNILTNWKRILMALKPIISGIELSPKEGESLVELKRYEDAIDALVCAWVGIEYLAGRTKAYGNETAAIWTPVFKPS